MVADSSTFVIRLSAPERRDAGTTRVARRTEGGGVTLEARTEVAGILLSETVTTATANAATLMPRASTTQGDRVVAALTYTPDRVSDTRGESDTLVVVLGRPVFNAAWEAEIARRLPITDGHVFAAEPCGAVFRHRTVSYQATRSGGNIWAVTPVGLEVRWSTPSLPSATASRCD